MWFGLGLGAATSLALYYAAYHTKLDFPIWCLRFGAFLTAGMLLLWGPIDIPPIKTVHVWPTGDDCGSHSSYAVGWLTLAGLSHCTVKFGAPLTVHFFIFLSFNLNKKLLFHPLTPKQNKKFYFFKIIDFQVFGSSIIPLQKSKYKMFAFPLTVMTLQELNSRLD